MKKTGIAITVLILTACGSVATHPSTSPVAGVTGTPGATSPSAASPSASPTGSKAQSPKPSPAASPTASPKVSSTLLFAALEAKGTANAWTYNTVAIAGLDGYGRAKTTFTPISVPDVGCMGAILPPSAHVAAGRVYFADGKGVIRSLATDGTLKTVATLPITSTQQMLSFAVSPDGSQVAATVLTVPKGAIGCSGSSSGTFTFDAYSVTSATANTLVYHQSWTTIPQTLMALTGWDDIGPFGTYPTVWASQGGGPGSTLGVLVRIDATTLKPGAVFSDPAKCQVWSSNSSAAFACLKNPVPQGNKYATAGSVRQHDGTELWPFSVVALNAAWSPLLAPDGRHVTVCCVDVSTGFAYAALASGSNPVTLANGFVAEGWLDSGTIIGVSQPNPTAQPPFNLSYVALNSPGVVVSMGFSGLFVGTVQS